MRPRKTKEIIKVLKQKGFIINPKKDHHIFFYLFVNGKKHSIHTYFSHGKNEYDSSLMGKIKNQLKFKDSVIAERFFDCPLSEDDYIKMLIENDEL